MGKRIPCILLLVVTVATVEAIQRNDPNVGRRYGPPSKRPAFNNAYPSPQYGPPPSSTGHYMPSPGHSSYQSSTGFPSSSYGNPGSYPTVDAKPPSSSYGPPPSAPSVSYSRPFGLPEGHRFPNLGYAYKLPQVPPPRPPVKALYISKPYPDYVIRFKPPTYPAEVPVLNKPGYGSGPTYKPPAMPSPPSYPMPPSSYPPSGPAPVYEPTGPIKAPIPIYENPSGVDKQVVTVIASTQDVNVGTSYQTGSNVNQYHSGLPSKIPVYSEAPSSVPLYPGQPPSTSAVYVISNDRLSNDKHQTGNSNVKTFVELSNDPAFGVTQQPGVIRPLTPDIVYSPNDPNNGAEFKPMYLFGPVFFPKGEGEGRDSASSGSSSSAISTELKSAVSNDAAAITPVVVIKNQTVTSKDVAEAVEAVSEESVDDATGKKSSSSGGGTGGRRGILGVVESILGIDDLEDDFEDGLSRADEDEKEEEVEPEEESNTEVVTSDRDSEGKRKNKPKYKSKTKTRYSSSTRRKNRNRTKTSNSQGSNVRDEPLEPAEEKAQEANRRPTAAVKDHELDVPQEEHGGNENSQGGNENSQGGNEHSEGEDEPDPIIGPVQIGYIGRPPPGAAYDQNQPFFYPAGIPPFNVQDYQNGPGELTEGSQEQDGVRRHFETSENPQIYEESQPQNAHQMDLMVAPTAELEQPVPQEVSALDNLKQDVTLPETSSVSHVQEDGLSRPMYAYHYPSYYDTVSNQDQTPDATSDLGQRFDAPTGSQDVVSTPQLAPQYAPPQNTASGNQQTVTYSSGNQEAPITTYLENSGSDSATLQQPSVPASSFVQVDQDIATATDNVDASRNELSSDNFVGLSGGIYDKQEVSSVSQAPGSQYDYSPSYTENDQAVSLESATVETSTQAASGSTRKPFPSFHHYRVGYRPKYNRNYVAPTTYRPVFHYPSSSTEASKDLPAVDDIDTSATIYNSLHYDITTTTAPINLDEHFNFDATTTAPVETVETVEIVTKPSRGRVRFGDKISSKKNS